jgi:signal transduction histidine kinase
MKNRNPRNLENEFHYGNGESAWFQLSIQPVPEGLFILSLDITKRKEAERQRRNLEREVLEISHKEQNRLGRDLHDGLGQQLTALELFSVSLATEADAKSRMLGTKVRKMGEHLREAIKQTRAMASGLSPVSLNEGGLVTALTKLAEGTCAMAKVDCKFICPAPIELGLEPGIHLYRIAQETTNNALKHGRAKKIRITLTKHEDRELRLAISDNGHGFSMSEATGGGMGLRVMKYRANLIGAELNVDSEPGKGTCVTCVLRQYV